MMEDVAQELLKRLVEVPSVNPEVLVDDAFSGEQGICDFLAGYLEGRGFSVSFQEVHPQRSNIIGVYGPEHPRKTVLFEAHVDTVGVSDMVDPFKARVKDGCMYGRGACDTKGAMAAALAAFTPDILSKLDHAGVRIIFVGAMGEEKGNVGARYLAESGMLTADEAVILEPTELSIVYAHKGMLWVNVDIYGRAAHGSNPQLGISAVHAMRRFLDGLDSWMSQVVAEYTDHTMGMPTLNIGQIEGGKEVNVVPDHCRVSLDRRIMPDEEPEKLLATITEMLEVLKADGYLVSYDVQSRYVGRAFMTRTESPLVKRLTRSIHEEGVEVALEHAAWYSDAGPLSNVCKDIIVYGPGSIQQAHTVDEYIKLSDVSKACGIIMKFLLLTAEETH